jgi:hypothetical protein
LAGRRDKYPEFANSGKQHFLFLEKGKQGAVMNKLLKQVFAVVKKNCLHQPNYCSVKPSKTYNFICFFTQFMVAAYPFLCQKFTL